MNSVMNTAIVYCEKRSSYDFRALFIYASLLTKSNYWKLFRQMLKGGVDKCYARLVACWHSHQTIYVCGRVSILKRLVVVMADDLSVHMSCSPANHTIVTK